MFGNVFFLSSLLENVDNSLNIDSFSSVSNDEVIRDISYYSDLKEKSLFESKGVFSKCFCIIAVKNNFQFRTTVSNLRSLEFRCLQEGCKKYVRASRYQKSDLWMLRKYTSNHDCSLSIAQSSHMQAFSILIANCLIDDFRFMSTDRSIPKKIMHKARTNLGVNISYQKVWRVKEHMVKILHGDTVESYALIPRFFDKLVESNPEMISLYIKFKFICR